MAKIFEEVLGPMLLTMPVNGSQESVMPSPLALRRKIILKHKKLPEGGGSFPSVDDSLSLARPDEDSTAGSNTLQLIS